MLEGGVMDIEELKKRLKKARAGRSLRSLAAQCEVSHELIRKLLLANSAQNITAATYRKIDKGLTKNEL